MVALGILLLPQLLLAGELERPSGGVAHAPRSLEHEAGILAPAVRVASGLDVLVAEDCARLAGERVALLTNKTGIDRLGRRNVDLLRQAPEVELVAILTPEHGFDAVLEGEVPDSADAASGLPLYSLYGETRRPTAAMLAGVDALVFDLADVGTRFYTYISTLDLAMQAAAAAGVRVVVLDRPNPIAPLGARGPVADSDRLSFIAARELPPTKRIVRSADPYVLIHLEPPSALWGDDPAGVRQLWFELVQPSLQMLKYGAGPNAEPLALLIPHMPQGLKEILRGLPLTGQPHIRLVPS